MTRHVPAVVITLAVSLAACGSQNSSSSSSSSSVDVGPSPRIWTLSGTVRAQSGSTLTGAKIEVLDGPNQGRSTSARDGGVYSLADLKEGDFNVRASITDYDPDSKRVTLNGNAVADFQLRKQLRADLVEVTDEFEWIRCGPIQCDYEGAVKNRGDGCATKIAGVIRLLTNAGVERAVSEWSLDSQVIVRPGEQHKFQGCCFQVVDINASGWYKNEMTWATTNCP